MSQSLDENELRTLQLPDLWKMLDEMGGATLKLVARDAAGEPLAAVILVRGQPETGEVVDAVEDAEADWEDDDDERPRSMNSWDRDGENDFEEMEADEP